MCARASWRADNPTMADVEHVNQIPLLPSLTLSFSLALWPLVRSDGDVGAGAECRQSRAGARGKTCPEVVCRRDGAKRETDTHARTRAYNSS